MNIDNSILQKYAPVIGSALVLILPAVDILAKNPTPIAVLQFLALLVTTATTFSLRAPWKQIVEWAGVIVSVILPLAINGDITWANWAFVAVAIVKALATHLGVAIRKDPEAVPAVATLESVPVQVQPQTVFINSSLPADAFAAADRLVQNDGLGKDIGGTNTPGQADHKA